MGLEEKLKQYREVVIEDAEYEVIEESSLPKTMYVIYTSKSGPTKWTHSKEFFIDYVFKNKSSKYKAVKAL